MALTTISARIDEQDKVKFDEFCSSVGLNTSIAINIFIKAVLREKKIPFTITSEVPNAETKRAMEEFTEMQQYPKRYKSYPTFQALVDEVAENAEDYSVK